jgi:hypothetical protein
MIVYDNNLLDSIIGVLHNEHAENLSDAELERCLCNCASRNILDIAKIYRDDDFLSESQL